MIFCVFLKTQVESMAAYSCSCDLLQKQLFTVGGGGALICCCENLCMFYERTYSMLGDDMNITAKQ